MNRNRHGRRAGCLIVCVVIGLVSVLHASQKTAELLISVTVVRSCSVNVGDVASRPDVLKSDSLTVSCVRGSLPEPRIAIAAPGAPPVRGIIDAAGADSQSSATPTRILTIDF